jgi:hypothetical protein
MMVVTCEVLLGVDDHDEVWPVPYSHQISVTSDVPPKPTSLFRPRKIAYL